MNLHSSVIRNTIGTVCVLLSAAWSTDAQSHLKRKDLCPTYSEVDPLIECVEVASYGGLVEVIENAPSGAEITFCPFFIRKTISVDPIMVKKGIKVTVITCYQIPRGNVNKDRFTNLTQQEAYLQSVDKPHHNVH